MAINFSNIFNRLPQYTMGDGNPDKWNKIADWVSRPAQNRLIMGGTGIVLQPWIDSRNKKVDEETREISRLRTIAKVGIGTCAGILVRQPCYDIVKACTSPEGNKRYSKWLIPKSKLAGLKENNPRLKNWRVFASTLSALSVMLFTNFLVDAPLTALTTNLFIKNSKKLEALQAKKNGGLDVKV